VCRQAQEREQRREKASEHLKSMELPEWCKGAAAPRSAAFSS
jgi:hypothetical protein